MDFFDTLCIHKPSFKHRTDFVVIFCPRVDHLLSGASICWKMYQISEFYLCIKRLCWIIWTTHLITIQEFVYIMQSLESVVVFQASAVSPS